MSHAHEILWKIMNFQTEKKNCVTNTVSDKIIYLAQDRN